MQYKIKQRDKFKYIEEGQGEPLLLLHGLFGALSNFMDLIEHFRPSYKVIVPMLPLFELDIFHTTVGGLEKHVYRFIEAMDYKNIHLLGNSLGGHVALVHTLKHPERIKLRWQRTRNRLQPGHYARHARSGDGCHRERRRLPPRLSSAAFGVYEL